MQEERKAHNKNFMTGPAWSISSWHMWSGPGAFPGFTFWRPAANSVKVKFSVIKVKLGVIILLSSDTSLWSFVCMSHFSPLARECLELPVRLLVTLHYLRLECVKSTRLTASVDFLCLF